MRKCVNWLIFAAIGLILALGAFIFNLWILPMMINYQVGKTMALENGTDAWDLFVDTPIPMYLKVYFFNVENPEGVANGEKPRVKEVGPYVYREIRKKYDLKINYENDTIFYHQGVKFTFDAERSHPHKEDDKIVLVNLAIHLVTQMMASVKYPFSLVNEFIEIALPEILGDNFGTTLKLTVREALFDGFVLRCSNKSLSTMSKTVCSCIRHFPEIKFLSKSENGDILGAVLRYKNISYDGLFEVNRGVKDFSQIGKIVSWEHQTKGTNWNGDYCNKIAGSYDLTLLPPFIKKDSLINVYSTDICSSSLLEFVRFSEFRGIKGLRFKPSSKFMGEAADYPENACFCPGSIAGMTEPGPCPLKGTLDLSSCMNVPAFISYPHFLYGSSYYQSLVDGLKPVPSLHETYIDVEETTGVPLRGFRRIQLNVLSKPTSAIRILKDTKLAMFPVLWFEEGAELNDKLINMLRDQLLKVLKIADIVKWVLVACGLCMSLIGIVMATLWVRKVHHHPD